MDSAVAGAGFRPPARPHSSSSISAPFLMPPNRSRRPDRQLLKLIATNPFLDSPLPAARSHQNQVKRAHVGVSPLLANFSFCAPENISLSLSMNSLSNSHDSRSPRRPPLQPDSVQFEARRQRRRRRRRSLIRLRERKSGDLKGDLWHSSSRH